MTFDSLATDVNVVLKQYGLHGVSNYWCEEVPLFELKVSSHSHDDIKKLFEFEGKIKHRECQLECQLKCCNFKMSQVL